MHRRLVALASGTVVAAAFATPAYADPTGTADLAVSVPGASVPAGADTSVGYAVVDDGPDPAQHVTVQASVTALGGARVRIDHLVADGDDRCTATDATHVGCFHDTMPTGATLGPADLFEVHVVAPADATGPVAVVHIEVDEDIADPDRTNNAVDVTVTATGGSASPSPSASPTAVPSASASGVAGGSGELPVTGVDLTPFLATGSGLLLAGSALLLLARRRADT
ncbi:MAG TPA: LPXTG cell wall anchor domain-containing protein [Actinocatenispora sp.]